MMSVNDSPTRELIAALLVLVAVLSAARGTRRLLRGLGQAAPLDIVRGLRGWAITVAVVALATAMFSPRRGFLVFGVIFLAEELYETGVLAIIIRAGESRASSEEAQGKHRAAKAQEVSGERSSHSR